MEVEKEIAHKENNGVEIIGFTAPPGPILWI